MENVIREEVSRLEVEIGKKFDELKKGVITESEFKQFAEKVDKSILELEKKLVELKKPDLSGAKETNLEMKAFDKLIRNEVLTPEERKVLTVGTDSQGGYIAPKEWYQELVKYLLEISPIRKYARVVQTSKRSVIVPKLTQRTGASWAAEGAAFSTETQPVFDQTEIIINTMRSLQKVSRELLSDSMFDVAGLLAELFAEDFAKLEGTAFVKGDGSGKPYGITAATYGGTRVLTATANTFVADDLITLIHSIPTAYMPNAILGVNRAILKTIRQFKDSSERYIWEPDFQNPSPGKVLGIPIIELPDLDDTVAGGKNIAIYGDLKQAFWIADNGDVEILVADQLFAANAQVGYFGFKRVGAAVVNPNAVAYLTVKSAQ